MHLFFNELSLQHQCPTDEHFIQAVSQIMSLRNIAQKYSRTIYCHRQITAIEVAPNKSMQQAVQKLDINAKRAFMSWMTSTGPFWDDERQHSPDEYFELIDSTVITDTGLGEAAYRQYHGEASSSVSWANSIWQQSPLAVRWHATEHVIDIEVPNHFENSTFATTLDKIQAPFSSWQDLHSRCIQHFKQLSFVDDCNENILQFPFVLTVANQVYSILNMLNRFASEHDATGKRTAIGQMYYQDWFTGKNAFFTDESDSNKAKFAKQLTFTLPDGTSKMCGMHGKPNTPNEPIRIHFSWPLNEDGKIYIVYIGKKITM